MEFCRDCNYIETNADGEPCNQCAGYNNFNKFEPKESEGKEMESYTTTEVLRMLDHKENNKKYINQHGQAITINENGTVIYFTNKNAAIISLKDIWKEYHEPVPFMEAAKAYKEDGKTIECKFDGMTFIYESNGAGLTDKDDLAVSADEILNGTWYIE